MTVWHEWMFAMFGTQMDTRLIGAITWADIALSCAVVVLIMMAHAIAATVIRRKRKATASEGELRHHTLGALRGPLYLLIWICGGYFALTPLVASSPLSTSGVLAFLRTLLNLGIFAMAFWFCFRFTRVVILPVLAIIFALPILGLPPAYEAIAAKGSSWWERKSVWRRNAQ